MKNIFSKGKNGNDDVKNIAGVGGSDSEEENSDSDSELKKKRMGTEEDDDDSDLSGGESKNAISEVKGFLQSKNE